MQSRKMKFWGVVLITTLGIGCKSTSHQSRDESSLEALDPLPEASEGKYVMAHAPLKDPHASITLSFATGEPKLMFLPGYNQQIIPLSMHIPKLPHGYQLVVDRSENPPAILLVRREQSEKKPQVRIDSQFLIGHLDVELKSFNLCSSKHKPLCETKINHDAKAGTAKLEILLKNYLGNWGVVKMDSGLEVYCERNNPQQNFPKIHLLDKENSPFKTSVISDGYEVKSIQTALKGTANTIELTVECFKGLDNIYDAIVDAFGDTFMKVEGGRPKKTKSAILFTSP